MKNIEFALKLAKDCTYADDMTEGAKEHLRNVIDIALKECQQQPAPQEEDEFERLLDVCIQFVNAPESKATFGVLKSAVEFYQNNSQTEKQK